MYVDSTGELRDIYVNSKVLRSPETEAICDDPSGIIWLVTSAETESLRDLYLSEAQREWLDSVRRNFSAVFVGRDNITSVYKLPCS